MPFKTTLEAALAHLKSKGVIKRDTDILEPLGIKSKGTVSSYATGSIKMSEGFRTKFENYYNIKLSDFQDLVGEEPSEVLKKNSDPEDYQAKYIALLEEHLEIKKALYEKIENFQKELDSFKQSHETIADNFTEAAEVIAEVRKAQHVMYALQNAYYQYFLGKTSADKEDAWQIIVAEAAKDLGLIQTKGIELDLDMMHNGS